MEITTDTLIKVARVCHEANRAYCVTIGDCSQLAWDDAPRWQRESAVAGVAKRAEDLDAPASSSHEQWLKQKEAEGWQFGSHKNAETKTHPCFVPYDDLPPEQQTKDHLFCAVCKALLTLPC